MSQEAADQICKGNSLVKNYLMRYGKETVQTLVRRKYLFFHCPVKSPATMSGTGNITGPCSQSLDPVIKMSGEEETD
jgi:hypothetical protein